MFTSVFCAELSIVMFFVLIFNSSTARSDSLLLSMLGAICTVIFSGMIVCFVAAELVHKKISRESRYTYVDIQEKTVILSIYGGEHRVGGEKIIDRELYYIPFEKLKGIQPEKRGRGIILTGEFRLYSMNSENLGYHIKDGEVVFDREWLSIGGFERVETVRIPPVFGSTERLEAALNEGKKRFIALPKPKPYVFKEADFIRRRAKPRLLPEDFGYSRKW